MSLFFLFSILFVFAINPLILCNIYLKLKFLFYYLYITIFSIVCQYTYFTLICFHTCYVYQINIWSLGNTFQESHLWSVFQACEILLLWHWVSIYWKSNSLINIMIGIRVSVSFHLLNNIIDRSNQ